MGRWCSQMGRWCSQMGRWCCLLTVLLSVWSAGGQQVGHICTRTDGTRGVWRDVEECLALQGTLDSAATLRLNDATDFSRVVVCCRSSSATIARNKCLGWQQQRRQSGSRCTATIPLVHGGQTAIAGEFPHIVSIMEDTSRGLVHVCGGSLIAPDWVLTAAHCVPAPRPALVVRLGAYDLRQHEAGFTYDVTVQRYVVHPGYRDPLRYNDIALLQLQFKAPVTARIQPGCVPYNRSRVDDGATLVVAGWGRTGAGEVSTSDVLVKANVKAIPRLECDQHSSFSDAGALLTYPLGITDSIICVDESYQGACRGDSGGPLMQEPGGACVQVVVGLVSRGVPGCSASTVPGLYTRIEYFRDWIVDTVWRDEY